MTENSNDSRGTDDLARQTPASPSLTIPDGIDLTPFSERFADNPYTVYKELREKDPAHRDVVGRYENSWTITSYDLIRKLLASGVLSVDPRKFGQRRDPRADNPVTLRDPDMMNLDEPDHSRLRSLVAHAFSPRHLAAFEPRIEKIVEEAIAKIDDTAPFDFVQAFAKPVPTIVVAELLGVDPEHHREFKNWTDTLLLQGFPQPTEAQWQAIVEADAALRATIEVAIAERRERPREDLISRLIAARDEEDKLSESEIIDMCSLIIAGGNFTTTDLMSTLVFRVLEKEGAWKNLAKDRARIDEAVEEALRFDGPSLSVGRFLLEDVEIDGHFFQKGDALTLVLAAANHDPQMWRDHDPDVFEPARAPLPHLAFGHGLHTCLGARLVRLEASVALKTLIKAYPDLHLPDQPIEYRKVMGFRGLKRLMVTKGGC